MDNTKLAFKCVEVNGFTSKEVNLMVQDGDNKNMKVLCIGVDGKLYSSEFPSASPTSDNDDMVKKIASLEQSIQNLAKTVTALDNKVKLMERASKDAK